MPIKPVFGIYLVWCLGCFGFQGLNFFLPETASSWPGFHYLYIFALILCLVRMTRIYQRQIEPVIRTNTARRLSWAGMLVMVFVLLYLLAGPAGIRSNLITALSTATLVLLACVVGSWLVTALKRPSEFIPIGMAVALSDMFSVFAGPTRHFAENISQYYRDGMTGPTPVVDFFLVKMPLPGNDHFMPVFGITDWVVIAILSAGALKFNMNDNLLSFSRPEKLTPVAGPFFPAAGAGLVLSIAAARSMGLYLPALPFIVIAFLAVMAVKYPEILKLGREEVRAMVFVGLLLIGLMVLFAFMKSRSFI